MGRDKAYRIRLQSILLELWIWLSVTLVTAFLLSNTPILHNNQARFPLLTDNRKCWVISLKSHPYKLLNFVIFVGKKRNIFPPDQVRVVDIGMGVFLMMLKICWTLNTWMLTKCFPIIRMDSQSSIYWDAKIVNDELPSILLKRELLSAWQ